MTNSLIQTNNMDEVIKSFERPKWDKYFSFGPVATVLPAGLGQLFVLTGFPYFVWTDPFYDAVFDEIYMFVLPYDPTVFDHRTLGSALFRMTINNEPVVPRSAINPMAAIIPPPFINNIIMQESWTRLNDRPLRVKYNDQLRIEFQHTSPGITTAWCNLFLGHYEPTKDVK